MISQKKERMGEVVFQLKLKANDKIKEYDIEEI